MASIPVATIKWRGLVETGAVWSFIDILLRSYGQIVFCNNPLTGLVLLLGFVDSPTSGILSLVGSASAIATAELVQTKRTLISSGLFGCNGALIGLAFSALFPVTLSSTGLLVGSASLCALLTRFLIDNLSVKFNLPVLSIPFLVLTWAGILFARAAPDVFTVPGSLPGLLAGGQIERVLRLLLPEPLGNVFRTLSAIFFQNSIYLGMFCLVGMVTYSRISTLFGLAAGAAGIALYSAFATGGDYYKVLTVGFNCALISIALGGIFVRLTWQAALGTFLAVLAGIPISLVLSDVLGNQGVPPLAAPFNLVTMFFLLVLKIAPAASRRMRLQPIPLALVSRPENNALGLRAPRFKQQAKLAFPFHGMWYVCAGNGGQFTHSGNSAYAWDFIVLDENRRAYRGIGSDNEDYYSFSLPVLAPAAGYVVKVVSSVPDNSPPTCNWEQSWGNYVLIEHGNNEFSEISHFRQFSIVVQEGDRVVTGQLLGYCGNSGLSQGPHIHYQLQNASSLGSATEPAKFHNYIIHNGPKRITVKEGVPQEGEFVSNTSEPRGIEPTLNL